MNKEQLQQELLEKVKAGIKPSDLKKLRGKNIQIAKPKENKSTSIPSAPPPPNSTPNNQSLLKKIKELELKNNSLTKIYWRVKR